MGIISRRVWIGIVIVVVIGRIGVVVGAEIFMVVIKAIVAGVRREGSWKAYCRVEHKLLIRLRSYLVRGYAETTDARVDRILRLPNGACWKVLAYWREAA